MIGEKVKYVVEIILMGQRSMTMEKISEELGVSDNTVRNMYKRDSVETKHILRLTEISGVPISYFFEDKGAVNMIANEGPILYGTNIGGANKQSVSISSESAYKNVPKDLAECVKKLNEAYVEIITLQKKVMQLSGIAR